MRRMLTISIAALAVLLGGAVAASAGGGGGGGACLAFADGDTLTMRDSCFEGIAHTTAGTTITVVNAGDLPHTVTAVDGSFDTGTVQPGATTTLTLDDPGARRIYCTLHGTTDGGGMAGVLDIVAAEPELEPAAAGTPTSGDLPWIVALVVVAGVGYLAGRRTERDTGIRSVPE